MRGLSCGGCGEWGGEYESRVFGRSWRGVVCASLEVRVCRVGGVQGVVEGGELVGEYESRACGGCWRRGVGASLEVRVCGVRGGVLKSGGRPMDRPVVIPM